MTSLPPNMIASSLQGSLPQRQAQQSRSVAERQQTDTSAAIARAAEQHEIEIDTGDGDTRISPDGQGGGSQGRSFEDGAPDQAPEQDTQASRYDQDDQAPPRLDITA